MTDIEKAWHPWTGSYRLAHCFKTGMDELNTLFPLRPQGAQEGTVGDLSHQAEGTGSDHNPNADGVVRAWDIDCTGNAFNPQVLADYLAKLMAQHHPMFGSKGYVIYNRRITSWEPWAQWQTYDGSDPHIQHIHLSVGANASEYDNTSPWNLASAFGRVVPVVKPIPKDEDEMIYVKFNRSLNAPTAIFSWNGANLLWITSPDYTILGRPVPKLIPAHAASNIWKCPIVPGTPDPRVKYDPKLKMGVAK